ncbi:hypothetical protein KTC96_20450 [Clostridium estertheticum]|uniref:hypothetical protein n=1 Tax=Clostridium estertheticum TaxID=238834 RepID=UPI001C7D2AEC|nr:hypothetical protein [Clostridium estertheticum]MBX4262754.1 hypothetical protein [Clostridium estertheticum]WLC70219.1 hypothetical protein KTC96_20450 [Clostridium estertheticum]
MNKKITSSVLVALMIAGSTYFSAFAAMPTGTVVIGTKAFDLTYANNSANASDITAAIADGGSVYVKDFNGEWIDNLTGLKVDAGLIPAVTYKDTTGVITPYNASDMGVSSTVAVTSVSATNGKQVQIKFNTPVDRVSAENADNYKIVGLDGTIMYIGKVVYLDPNTVMITLDFNSLPPDDYSLGTDIALNNGSSYKLTVSKDLAAANGKQQLTDLTSTFKFTDTSIPKIAKVSLTSGGVQVYFNESIKGQRPNGYGFSLKLLDKNGVPIGANLLLSNMDLSSFGMIMTSWIGDEHETLTMAPAEGLSMYLHAGSRYRLSFSGSLTDYSGHNVPLKSTDITYAVDKTAPQVLSTKYISQKYVEVTFNKPVYVIPDDFYWNTDGNEDNIENKSTDVLKVNETTFRVGFNNLMTKGNNFIYEKDVSDYSNNIISTTKNPITVTGNVLQATSMYVNDGLNSGSVNGDEYFTINYSNNIDPNTIVQGWNGADSKDITLMATDGGTEGSDTLSLGNVGTITFSGNEITSDGTILGTVSMPYSNQIKVKLGAGATTVKFANVISGIMTYKATPVLVSTDVIPINSNPEITSSSDNFLIAKRIYLDCDRSNNNFDMQDNYGADFNGANIKINTLNDFGVSTAVDSLYKGAEVTFTVTSVGKVFTNGLVSIIRAAGSGVAIAKGEILYLRVEDGSDVTSNTLKIVFNKDIATNGAVTNADFIVTP